MIEVKKNNFLINEEVNKCLKSIINKKSYANGYIFYGPEGDGKKQTALKFIKEIFKQSSLSPNVEEKITNNNPDFLMIEPSYLLKAKKLKSSELEKKSRIGSEVIKIDQIRGIKTFLGQKSINSGKKIVLICDAHFLNESASNCLLKTIEEPSNGIFILLTSKVNLLLDTIISRCQKVRFKSFSSKQINTFLKDDYENSKLNLSRKFKTEDLINYANGSPGQFLKNIEIWNELSDEVTSKLDYPLQDSLEILEVCRLISEQLEIYEQIFLVNFIQILWWRNTKNVGIVKKLEKLKIFLRSNIQPRLSWEITLLKIAIEINKI